MNIKIKPLLTLSLLAFTVIGMQACKKKGCTDSEGLNYDADAKKDDGSCTYEDHGEIVFHFEHNVGGTALVFDDAQYTNAAGNNYSVITLKYFVSDITLHKADGSTYKVDEEHYVDGTDESTHEFKVHDIPNDAYSSISMIFGLNETKNVAGRYTNPPESNMEWPTPMGPGYHYMKLEGKFDSAGTTKNYNVHTGASMNVPYFVETTLSNSAVTIAHDAWDVHLEMDINQWFTNPNTYDFNAVGEMIMGNASAQQTLKENGASVWSVGSISESQHED